MSMRIQDALSNCCEGVKDFAFATADWIGKTVTATAAFIAEGVEKVAELVKPYFENLKTFAQENRDSILIAGIAFIVGAIGTAITTQLFCNGTNTSPNTGTSSAAAP